MTQPSAAPSGKPAAIACATLLLATVLATAQLIYWGSAPYYGYDELWHTALAAVSPPWLSLQLISADVHPPLHYLLLRPLTRIGSEPFFPRLAAIVPSILSVPLWYLLLRKLRVKLAPALAATVILALSHSFIDVGVTVRSYSLATLLMLGGLWFWIDLLPARAGTDPKPSRWSAVLSLGLFSAAFWTLYVTVFMTASLFIGTLLVLLLQRPGPPGTGIAWRRFGGWPEWLAFVAVHLLGIAWMWLGWHHHGDHSITGHIDPLLPVAGQSTVDYLISGLRLEIGLYTPLAGCGDGYRDACLWGLLLLIIGLFVHQLRRGNSAAAVIVLLPLLITAWLALSGTLSLYPFGGYLRHQYILFPSLLLLLPLSLNAFWKRLPTLAQALLLTAILVLTWQTVSHSHRQAGSIGDAPPTPFWDTELQQLFTQGGDPDTVIVTPAYTSYAVFMNRWVPGIHHRNSYRCDGADCSPAPQGFAAILEPWPDFLEFSAYADDRSEVRILRYARATIGPRPGPEFLDQLTGMLKTTGRNKAQIFSAVTRDIDRDPRGDTADALRALVAKHGLILSDYRPVDHSVIWTVERAPKPTRSPLQATTNADQASPIDAGTADKPNTTRP